MSLEPYYPHESIASITALSKHLGVTEKHLVSVANRANQLYKEGPELKKPDGSLRATHDAKPELKSLHELIKNKLLKKVIFPDYIQGGVSDPKAPRSYISHSRLHTGKKIIVSEDIASFYPNNTEKLVMTIWKRFFNFPEDVAKILTKLTVYKGALPQGWKPSGYLANLAFFDVEFQLVKKFKSLGFTYSRYIDDITVSSSRKLTNREISQCISEIIKMLANKGFKIKRAKHEIARQGSSMNVMGLTINTKKPQLSKDEKKRIRAMVHKLEYLREEERLNTEYEVLWNQASGKVARMTSLKLKQGKALRERLAKIKPRKQ